MQHGVSVVTSWDNNLTYIHVCTIYDVDVTADWPWCVAGELLTDPTCWNVSACCAAGNWHLSLKKCLSGFENIRFWNSPTATAANLDEPIFGLAIIYLIFYILGYINVSLLLWLMYPIAGGLKKESCALHIDVLIVLETFAMHER